MATQGAQSGSSLLFSQEFIALIAYLNPENSRISDKVFREFTLKSLSADEFSILSAVLQKSKATKLCLTIEEIATEPALALLKLALNNKQLIGKHLILGEAFEIREDLESHDQEIVLNNFFKARLASATQSTASKIAQIMNLSAAKVIEINIPEIAVGTILFLLAAIDFHPIVTDIDIKLPLYNVNNLNTLREFLKKPISEQVPLSKTDEEDMSLEFSNMIIGARADFDEIMTVAGQTMTSIYDRGRTFLNSYINPVVDAIRDDFNEAMNLDEQEQRQGARPTL